MIRLPGFLFRNRYRKLLPVLQRGHTSELNAMLWQPLDKKIEYLPVTFSILQKLQAPPGEKPAISIERVYSTWNFDLVIFHTPWSRDKIPYHPLIFYRRAMKVAGVILPFNELSPYLTNKAKDQIFGLGKIWILLTLKMHSK